MRNGNAERGFMNTQDALKDVQRIELVTGASRGIGAAIAKKLASQ